MKTKHLLTGLVLPAIFAACTADEIETSKGMVQENLNLRPSVGNVVLNFGNANSRAALDLDGLYNTIEFAENEDGIGARIIDIYEAANVKDKNNNRVAWKDYTIKDFASTNYRYVYNGENWATNALMVEGNYMFYFPYNANNLNRGPLEIITPTHQTILPNEEGGEKNAIAELYAGENPVFVGYKFISAEDQELEQEVDMKPLFAYPYITLKNDFVTDEGTKDEVEHDVTITKVVFSSTESMLKDKYVVNHESIQAKLTEEVSYQKTTGKELLMPAGEWTDDTKFVKYATTASIAPAPETAKDVEITVEFEGGLDLAYGDEYSFYVVLPSAVYSAGKLDMTIYTEDGKMIGSVTEDGGKTVENIVTFDNGKTMRFAPGKRYATQEYDFPKNEKPAPKKNAGKYGVYEIEGANLALIDAIAPAPVISTLPEFEEFLKSIDENVEGLKEIASARTTGEGEFILAEAKDAEGNGLGYAELALNKEFLALLEEYNYDGNIEFLSKMVAEGAATSADQLVLDGITFKGGLIAAEGYTTVKNITLNNNLTVTGGVLTINHNAAYAKPVEVKAGEAIVANAGFISNNPDNVNIITAGVTLDEEDEVIATGKVTLNYTGESNLGYKRAEVAGGELVIGANVVATAGSTTAWTEGTVTNNGTLKVVNSFAVAKDITLENNNKVEGTLNNNGSVKTAKNLTLGTNTGTVELTNKNALVSGGSGTGVIDNTIAGKVSGSSNAVVAYIEALTDIEGLAKYDDAAGITKYILNGEWNIEDTDDDVVMDKEVEFAAGSSLNVASGATLQMNENAIISANVTWTGRTATVSKVNFAAGKEVVFNKYASVAGSTTLDTYYNLTLTDLNVTYNNGASNIELKKIQNAGNGDIINLNSEVNLVSPLTIDKNITIKGGKITGKPITVASTAEVVFDGVTFNNATGTKESAIYLKNSTKNITVKNCTFEACKWDALQIVEIANNITVTIEGNTFKTLAAGNDGGSYIHIANKAALTNSAIVIKNNTFGAQEDKVNNDYMVKIYGVIAYNQITVGGNNFVDAYSTTANQILINDFANNTKTGDSFSAQKAYTQFEQATAAALAE